MLIDCGLVIMSPWKVSFFRGTSRHSDTDTSWNTIVYFFSSFYHTLSHFYHLQDLFMNLLYHIRDLMFYFTWVKIHLRNLAYTGKLWDCIQEYLIFFTNVLSITKVQGFQSNGWKSQHLPGNCQSHSSKFIISMAW